VSRPTHRAALDGSYLTPIQVSVRTGIPKATLAKWRKDGRPPLFVRRGGRIVYPSRELEVWLRAQRRE
jgi:predicted site-specific integrase-resolvase